MSEKEYKLKIEILVDNPNGAYLKKGQICRANVLGVDDYHVEDTRKDATSSQFDWSICGEFAKVVS